MKTILIMVKLFKKVADKSKLAFARFSKCEIV